MSEDYNSATVEDVMSIIDTMEDADKLRSKDRAIINAQFNGSRPYTDAEVEEHQISVNANFLEGYEVALSANLQVNGALLNKDKFFNARCLVGKPEKREDIGRKFTDNIHKAIRVGRSGLRHAHVLKNRNASLTLHGVGALVWMTPHEWLPRFIPLDDLLIPTDSPQDFTDELCHFGVNAQLTPYQLLKLTHGAKVDKGWDIKAVRAVVKSINTLIPHTQDLGDYPEKWESLIKQKGLYMDSDAVPKIKITYFFSQNSDNGKWYRKIVFRTNDSCSITEEMFLYDSKDKPFADYIEEIIHIQYGDGNVVPPFKFHSVRGLGILLYSVVELMNRMRCQFNQHIFEQLMAILRIQNPGDRDRPKILQLHPYAVLEDGVTFVPPQERHQADPKLVEFGMSQNRQLISEAAASYIQDVDTGTNKEQTLGEAKIKLQSANKIVSGMLSNMYLQEAFYYQELVRRFLLPAPSNPEIIEFQKKCAADGIPKEMMVVKAWKVDVEQVFGMGDQTLAIDEVNALLQIAPQLDPTAKMLVLRKYIATITRNSDLATVLVPMNEGIVSNGTKAAEDVFGTLMLGVKTSLREGVEKQDYVTALLQMMEARIAIISQSGGVGEPQDVVGLQTVAASVGEHLQVMSMDANNKQFVTEAGKQMGKLMNEVKAFAQRQQQEAEAKAKKEQENPEAMAKAQAMMQQAQVKTQIAESQAEMKSRIKMLEHQQKMQMQQEAHAVNMQAQQQRSAAEQGAAGSRVASDLQLQQARTEADIQAQEAKTRADISANLAQTEAEIRAMDEKNNAEIVALQAKVDAEIAATKKAAEEAPKPTKQDGVD